MAKKPYILLALSAALLLTLHTVPAQQPSTAVLQQLRACEFALVEAEQTCGKHSKAYAQALKQKSDALWDFERYDAAIEAERPTAELCETLYGERSPEHADARYGSALKYAFTHRNTEYRKAMYTDMRLKKTLVSEKEEKYFTRMFRENEGTEASFKSLSGRNTRIIHLATHGFYVPPVQKDVSDGGTLEDNALARCGAFIWPGRTINYEESISPRGSMTASSQPPRSPSSTCGGWTSRLSKYEALERAKSRVRNDEHMESRKIKQL